MLFDCFKEVGIINPQNYIPIYNKFFSLTETNFKKINLNHKFHIRTAKKTTKHNKYMCELSSDSQKDTRLCFFKFSPLLDPVKYMVGKYSNLGETERMALPQLESNECHKKVLDATNSAYVDSFFSYLTSRVCHECYFPHGLDFYGSFLGIQKEFVLNVADDIEYLNDSTFFHKNQNNIFKLDTMDLGMLMDFDTRNYKKKLNIGKKVNNGAVSNLTDKDFNGVFITLDDVSSDAGDISNNLVFKYDLPISGTKKTSSTCSSRSSNTSASESEEQKDAEIESSSSDNEHSSGSLSSFDSDMEVKGIIYNFPIQIICLECMDGTLDSLLNEEDEMDDDGWRSCLFQIIMMLIVYQKLFDFTHNDLHTNNIMFKKTDKKYLLYRYNHKYYKVPTFGRIFKIIDFGRAIYKYMGHRICSDSYHPKGDAATQYNCEPYFNPKKPRLEPNASFDLCRLACSLFDYFIEDLDEIKTIRDPIAKLMIQWTKDDKDRNILYKNNGEERYPDFKLYKMIARTVHAHLPQKQVEDGLFRRYQTTRKKLGKKAKVVDVDKMPSYTDI